MIKNILILTDYKGFFGSKQKSKYYRGGFDLDKLDKLFSKKSFNVQIMSFAELNLKYEEIIRDRPIVLYQSSEDKGAYYKSFIEDVIYDLEKQGVSVIPNYEYLKAHNNKVAMELLRNRSGISNIQTIKSYVFGTYEEIFEVADKLSFPTVIKSASGAMSKGVGLVSKIRELNKFVRKVASSKFLWHDIKENLRKIKYSDKYLKESFYRNKFISQNLISGLDNDYKVLVYGDKCYVLYRGVREGDFRASGSGKFQFRKSIPNGMLDYAHNIKSKFNVPNISLDIAFDGDQFHLIEFQFIMFGTTTLEKSPFYFILKNNSWVLVEEKSDLEEVYTSSIINYLIKS